MIRLTSHPSRRRMAPPQDEDQITTKPISLILNSFQDEGMVSCFLWVRGSYSPKTSSISSTVAYFRRGAPFSAAASSAASIRFQSA